MPLVCPKFKNIFLLNPRTGGTALSRFLIEHNDWKWLPKESIYSNDKQIILDNKHATSDELIKHKIIRQEEVSSFNFYVVVRNPYDSIVSLYHKMTIDYRKKLEDKDSWIHKKGDFAKKMREMSGMSFTEWVKYNYIDPESNRIKKRSLNVKYITNNAYILRFENLKSDVTNYRKKLEFKSDVSLFTVSNKTQSRKSTDYKEYYNDETKIVSQAFDQDLKILGYKF